MYRIVAINATTEEEAHAISELLVEERLVAGTRITGEQTSHYWWDGDLCEESYWCVYGYTVSRYEQEIIDTVTELHSDECPAIVFQAFDANPEFLVWTAKETKINE